MSIKENQAGVSSDLNHTKLLLTETFNSSVQLICSSSYWFPSFPLEAHLKILSVILLFPQLQPNKCQAWGEKFLIKIMGRNRVLYWTRAICFCLTNTNNLYYICPLSDKMYLPFEHGQYPEKHQKDFEGDCKIFTSKNLKYHKDVA